MCDRLFYGVSGRNDKTQHTATTYSLQLRSQSLCNRAFRAQISHALGGTSAPSLLAYASFYERISKAILDSK